MKFPPKTRVLVSNEPRTMKFEGTVVNFNAYREPSMAYAVQLDLYTEDFVFVGEDQLELIEEEKVV